MNDPEIEVKKVQRQVNAQDALNQTQPQRPRQIGEDSDEFADPSGEIPDELYGDAGSVSPLDVVGVNGVAAAITGSYSSSTPYLWFNIAANTAQWLSSTLSPFPLDTIILDGRKGYPSEYWHLR